nr:translation initiation factor IF-2-like [Aegilops tauschii subsp. strangulata]
MDASPQAFHAAAPLSCRAAQLLLFLPRPPRPAAASTSPRRPRARLGAAAPRTCPTPATLPAGALRRARTRRIACCPAAWPPPSPLTRFTAFADAHAPPPSPLGRALAATAAVVAATIASRLHPTASPEPRRLPAPSCRAPLTSRLPPRLRRTGAAPRLLPLLLDGAQRRPFGPRLVRAPTRPGNRNRTPDAC